MHNRNISYNERTLIEVSRKRSLYYVVGETIDEIEYIGHTPITKHQSYGDKKDVKVYRRYVNGAIVNERVEMHNSIPYSCI